jgi:dephospho-CoA kinase
MVNIAICGKMASGKTTLANNLMSEIENMNKYSLAKAVKDFAHFVYDIPEGHKDRVAFQKIGDGARKFLYEDVWIDTVLKAVAKDSQKTYVPSGHYDMDGNDLALDWENPDEPQHEYHCIIDDVRYLNEVKKLKANGWIIIKLEIDEGLQKERLQNTYPSNWETHFEARNHASEVEIDYITENMVDLVINAEDNKKSLYEVLNLLFPQCEILS